MLIPSYDEIMAEFKDTLFTHGLSFSRSAAVDEKTELKAIESAAANSLTNVSKNNIQVPKDEDDSKHVPIDNENVFIERTLGKYKEHERETRRMRRVN